MIEQINEDNFKQLDPQLLMDDKWYPDVEDMVISIGAAATADYAKEYAIALADKLDKVGEQMPRELFDRYLKLLSTLRLFSLRSVKDDEKEKFFREQVLNVFQLDFADPQYYVDDLIRSFWTAPEIISQTREGILRGLESNVQRIGREDLIIPGQEKTTHPTIGNWLRDYSRSTVLTKNKMSRGSLEELTYINQSPNVRKLSKTERDVLLKVMKLDDWLRYNDFKYDFGFSGQVEADQQLEGEMHNLIPDELIKVLNQGVSETPLAEPSRLSVKQPIVQVIQLYTKTQPRPIVPIPPRSPVSVPPSHGRDLEVLREQLERGQGSGEREKGTSVIKMTPAEIKHEVAEIELPGHQEPREISGPVSPSSASVGGPKPIQAPSSFKSASSLQSLAQISMVDDLKKIEIAHLRQGPLAQQLQTIRSKIFSIAQANRLYPYYTVNAFEQSPLFRAYLQTGSSKITENKTEGGLSQAEFEAIADFKKEIERL